MSADCNISNKKKINLATFTYRNDAAYKSYVDGVKQAETSVFVPIYFFLIMKWIMIVKRKPNS